MIANFVGNFTEWGVCDKVSGKGGSGDCANVGCFDLDWCSAGASCPYHQTRNMRTASGLESPRYGRLENLRYRGWCQDAPVLGGAERICRSVKQRPKATCTTPNPASTTIRFPAWSLIGVLMLTLSESGFLAWGEVESYIAAHSEATFTHGLCPNCWQKFFADHASEAGKP